MFELIAEGADSKQRWRESLSNGRTYVLGRSDEADLSVVWDHAISRRHVSITATDSRVQIERLADSTNSLCHNGEVVS